MSYFFYNNDENSMLLAPYDYATDIAVQREEAYEEGRFVAKLVIKLRMEQVQDIEIARILKTHEIGSRFIQKITGISDSELKSIYE